MITASLAGLLAGMVALALTATLAEADTVKTGVQLYMTLSGDKLSDKLNSATTTDDPLAASDSASSTHSKQLDLGSVPLTVSAADSDGGWGAALGGKGQYVTSLSDSFSLFGHGGFAKTQSLNGSLFGDTAMDAGPGLQYRQGTLAMILQPDVGVTLQSDAVQQVDYGVNSTVSKDLANGLTATSTNGYTIQSGDSGDLASSSAGLSYTLSNKVKLGAGYQIEQTLGSGDSFLSGKQGPSLSAQVPVTDNVNLGTTYAYVSSAASADSDDASAKGRDVAQTLGVSADWNLGADINADVTLKAKLDVTRETDAGTSQASIQKAGSVGMQMKF